MSLEELLRRTCKQSEESIYRIARNAGVEETVLRRFVNGKRGISLKTAQKLIDYFGIECRLKRNP